MTSLMVLLTLVKNVTDEELNRGVDMNYFLLQDLEEGVVDSIIITTASKEQIENAIAEAKELDCYSWEDIQERLPEGTQVVDCFNNKNRIYY